MKTYEIAWSAFGIAEIEADSLDEALEIADEGCMSFDDIGFEGNQVDGVDTELA